MDYTGGTKSMSAAAVLTAVDCGCRIILVTGCRIILMTGPRDNLKAVRTGELPRPIRFADVPPEWLLAKSLPLPLSHFECGATMRTIASMQQDHLLDERSARAEFAPGMSSSARRMGPFRLRPSDRDRKVGGVRCWLDDSGIWSAPVRATYLQTG